MKTKLVILASIVLTHAAFAAPQTFDFKDPKGVNTALFKLDAPLEAVNGSGNGITGTIAFDSESPTSAKGKITITTASLTVPNSMMNGHLHSDKWLDATKYPEVTFEAKELKNIKTTGNVTTADVTGTFTLKDVSKDITIPVKFTYLKDKLGDRVPNMKGDLLVVRTSFSISRKDYNVAAGQYEDKVSDNIDLTLSIAGASVK
jgi:polyisoprenoid-binding protein YceI